MKYFRSLLFIPADREKMLDKVDLLFPDAFILDLEDSVSDKNKELARINITNKLALINVKDKVIFVRLNDLDSEHVYKDICSTASEKVYGYMIPKFESIDKLKKIIDYISKKEKELKIASKIKIILMIESPKGLLELNKLDKLYDRIIAIAFGAEDYLFSLSECQMISNTMLDFARNIIIIHSKANNLLSIDTVYKDYKNSQGLKEELNKIKSMGFSSKLAIHPDQIEIINSSFTPTDEEINRARLIIKYAKDIEENGAISIDGIMYDPPHLKWAKMITEHIEKIL